HRRAQCRIDASGQTQNDAWKSILVYIIAKAQHTGSVVGAIGFNTVYQPTVFAVPGGVAANPVRRDNRFLKRGKLEGQRAIRVQAKRYAIEHQLILASDLIDVDCRQPLLGNPCHRDIEPHVTLLAPIGDPLGTMSISAPVSARHSTTSAPHMSSQIGIPKRTPRKFTGPGIGPGEKTRFSSNTP